MFFRTTVLILKLSKYSHWVKSKFI